MFSLVERWRLALLRAAIARGSYRDDTSTPERNRLLFYRWLYSVGRLSDSPSGPPVPSPAQSEAPAQVRFG